MQKFYIYEQTSCFKGRVMGMFLVSLNGKNTHFFVRLNFQEL